MRIKITEETYLLITVIRWILYASIIGIIVGLSTTIFLKLLNQSISLASKYEYFFLFVPLALLSSYLIINKLAPDAKGHGTEKVIEAIHQKQGNIKASVVPIKLITTIITIACGGSAGKEGPCAQIGAGLASTFANIFKFDEHDRKKLVICGISAGFASVFGTPIAGAIFGVEVIFAGGILYDVLLPSFVSGIISYHVTDAFGIKYFYHPLNYVQIFSHLFFIKVLLAGIFFGLCSFILIELLRLAERISKEIKIRDIFKPIFGGLLLIFLTLIFSTKYLGLGLTTIEETLLGKPVIWYDFLMKSIFTSITLSFGGSGGIITPIFFVGSTAGNLFAQLFNLNLATFSALGLVGLLAGAANTPIAASIMAIELFGPQIAPYAALSCVISFLITGHRSVYPSQVLALRKSKFIDIETGKEMEKINLQLSHMSQPRIIKIMKRFINSFNKNRRE